MKLPVVDGCANCEGVPFSGYPFKDGFCSDGLFNPDLTSYVSNSYIIFSGNTELDIPPACQCMWCPPEPPSGFDEGNYDDAEKNFNDFVLEDWKNDWCP